jgi:hypothetical protein
VVPPEAAGTGVSDLTVFQYTVKSSRPIVIWLPFGPTMIQRNYSGNIWKEFDAEKHLMLVSGPGQAGKTT